MAMFKDFADIQTADMLDLPTPEVKYENIILEPSELQKEMVQKLSERAAKVQSRSVDAKVDNMREQHVTVYKTRGKRDKNCD